MLGLKLIYVRTRGSCQTAYSDKNQSVTSHVIETGWETFLVGWCNKVNYWQFKTCKRLQILCQHSRYCDTHLEGGGLNKVCLLSIGMISKDAAVALEINIWLKLQHRDTKQWSCGTVAKLMIMWFYSPLRKRAKYTQKYVIFTIYMSE